MNGLATLEPLAEQNASMEHWQLMREQATIFVRSGMLPAHIKSPEQAIVIMLKGRELGLPPLYALATIAVIGGKPVVAAEVMAALIYRHHGDQALRVVQSDESVCIVEYRRRGWSEARSYAFSIEDAQRAGLLNGNVWQKYPAAMLRARCISSVARMAFPDVISGVYTPEELGGRVQVIEDEVVQAAPDAAGGAMVYQTDAALPPPRPLRLREVQQIAAPPAAEQLGRIARMRRARAVWYGEDEALPAPATAEEAEQAMSLLQKLLRLRVPDGDRPVTTEQLALVREAIRDLEAAGGAFDTLPEDLTRGRAYSLYKDLLRQRASLEGTNRITGSA